MGLLHDAAMSIEESATLGLMALAGNLKLTAGPERAIEVLQFCVAQIENEPSNLRLLDPREA